MLGFIALGFLILSYIAMFRNVMWLFVVFNIIATTLFFIHAFMIQDLAFAISNGFIAFVLMYRFFKDKHWKHFKMKSG